MYVRLTLTEYMLGAKYFAYIFSTNAEVYLIYRYYSHFRDELAGAQRD